MKKDLPVFTTSRLILKAVTIEDAPAYQRHFSDYEVIRYLSSQVPWPYPDNGAEFFIQNMILPRQGIDRWCWGIFEKDNANELIGAVDLWRVPIPENRGFWLGKKFWGKGYMTEAVTPVTEYAFSDLGFEELFFTNALGNERSRRVKEKTSAKFIELRDAKFVDSSFSQTELWKLTKNDWESRIATEFSIA
jgi:ribosomal-protein-alanine N-acetyltransferase